MNKTVEATIKNYREEIGLKVIVGMCAETDAESIIESVRPLLQKYIEYIRENVDDKK